MVIIFSNSISISNVKNLNIYIKDYSNFKTTQSFDNTVGTVFIDKVNNKSIYSNNFENCIYVNTISTNNALNSIILKQGKKLYCIADTRQDLDLLIPTTSEIYIYKDYKTLNLLTQERELTYFIPSNDIFTDYEVLEVIFNGKSLDHWIFDPVLKKIQLGSNILPYQFLNSIQIVLGKKITDINEVEIIVEHIDHTIFDINEPLKEVKETYFNLSDKFLSVSLNRDLFEMFTEIPVFNNKAYHKNSKNFRTETTLKIIPEYTTGSSLYGSGLYGAGFYGSGNKNYTQILTNNLRFRMIIFDNITGNTIIINNCKARDTFSRDFSDDINSYTFIIDGDKEMVFGLLTEKSGYIYPERCN